MASGAWRATIHGVAKRVKTRLSERARARAHTHLGFSLTAQCMWFTLSRQLRVSNFPDYYMDESGEFHDWKAGDEHDSRLVYLVRDNTESFYRTNRVPFSMNVNFKVTKKLLGDRMNVALFCNKLWDYNPSYKSGTTTIRRHVTPYFGLEANFVF